MASKNGGEVLYSRSLFILDTKRLMTAPKPSVSLGAVPGRRHTMLELAQEIERREFEGIYCTSLTDGLAFSLSIALRTTRVQLGTSIIPIYHRVPYDFAYTAAFISEVSDGRFRFGIGVSHGPALERAGIKAGKPLADIRAFVEAIKAVPRAGELPPIVLAAMRKKMIALAGEISDGMVFANGARSHMGESLSVLPPEKRESEDFFIGAMIPTCISDDEEAAKAVNRRTLSGYVILPNYRNYWKEAGYEEEMAAVEKALERRDRDAVAACMTDKWLADVTLFGSAAKVQGRHRSLVREWHQDDHPCALFSRRQSAGGLF